MIYYFSGSGNSHAVANGLSHRLHMSVSKVGAYNLRADNSIGFVLPVYAWGIPPHVLQWLLRVKIPAAKPEYVWAVLTYGDEAALAHRILQATLKQRGIALDAVWGVQMPNTYVLLPGFNVDPESLAQRKLMDAEVRLDNIGNAIRDRQRGVTDLMKGPMARLKSRLIYPLFKKAGIFPSKWKVDPDRCTGCSMCAAACPVGNVRMTDQHPVYSGNGSDCGLYLGGGRPQWGKKCTSCLACYHACPHHAVNYGNATQRKGQWRHWFMRHTQL